MYDGWTSGVKIKCPKCGSDDCNDTTGHQTVLGIKVAAHVVYCNTCGYQKEELLKDGAVIWSKWRECGLAARGYFLRNNR